MPYNSCNFTIWANKRNIIQYLLFTKTFSRFFTSIIIKPPCLRFIDPIKFSMPDSSICRKNDKHIMQIIKITYTYCFGYCQSINIVSPYTDIRYHVNIERNGSQRWVKTGLPITLTKTASKPLRLTLYD